jgi:hypothetical protein
MEDHYAKLTIDILAAVSVAVACMGLSAIPTTGQQQGRVYVPPVMESRESDMARQRDTRERESLRRSLGKRPERIANVLYVRAIVAQVKEDFERIQVIRNEIVRATSANNGLDYKFISQATEEIKKRSSRLKNNLALPDSEENEKSKKSVSNFNHAQIKDALHTLCNRIESFVKSSIFETPGVIDAELSVKANRDLQSMIELSSNIRNVAQRLTRK